MSNRIFSLFPFFFCLVAGIGALGCGGNDLRLVEASDSRSRLLLTGDLHGPGILDRTDTIQPSSYRAGYGVGSPDGANPAPFLALGGFFVQDDPAAPGGKATAKPAPMVVTHALGIVPRSRPVAVYEVRSEMDLADALLHVAGQHGDLVAVLGAGTFRQAEGLFGDTSRSLSKPELVFFSIADSTLDISDGGKTARIFDLDDRDTRLADVLSTTCYGVLPQGAKANLDHPEDIAGSVTEVGRLFSQSRITDGLLYVYAIDIED